MVLDNLDKVQQVEGLNAEYYKRWIRIAKFAF